MKINSVITKILVYTREPKIKVRAYIDSQKLGQEIKLFI